MHRLPEFIRREVGGRYFPDSDVSPLEEGPPFFMEDAWKPEPFAFFRGGCGKTHPPCRVEPFAFMPKRGFGRRILPLLVRKSRTQQKKLGREQRLDGIGSSYFPVGEKKSRKLLGALFSGKIPNAVVLLDDVMTTGSTLEDCAEILKEMGVAHVYCVTLFTVA